MKKPIVLHLSSGPASTEYARITGMIQREVPETPVSFGTLTLHSPLELASYLYTTLPYFPEGSIFLSYIDEPPDTYKGGITAGENKDFVVCQVSTGSLLLSPNNGSATLIARHLGIREVRKVNLSAFGGDFYAPARLAARLSAGMSPEEAGPLLPMEDLVLFSFPQSRILPGLAEGCVAMVLRTFGNLTFTISIEEFEATGIANGDLLRVTFTRDGQVVYQENMTYQKSFGYVPVGAPLIFNGSSGYLDIGLNQQSFAEKCLPSLLKDDPLTYHVRIEKLKEAEA